MKSDKTTNNVKRQYYSSVRQKKAQATRERVMSVAKKHLNEKGFARINFEDVAKEAGVTLQTVYRICGSKKKMLEDRWREHKDKEERAGVYLDKVTRERREALYKRSSANIERQAAHYLLLQAQEGDTKKQNELMAEHENFFRETCREFIQGLGEDGLLRPGLDVETAADFYWGIQSPELFDRFFKTLGWSEKRFAAMLYEVIGLLIMDRTYIADTLHQWRAETGDAETE